MCQEIRVLDVQQLKRIESVHRGFLYQHLFATGCLLLAPASNIRTVIVERDEDVELVTDDRHVYIQVKTRAETLQPNDIDSTLQRFDRIREEHLSGNRAGSAEFWIVSSAPPSPGLHERLQSRDWAPDVAVRWPGCDVPTPQFLPPAWADLAGALQWCSTKASELPFRKLSAETLVWKLAAVVQYACTGNGPTTVHAFAGDHTHDLFEQFVAQLQSFPASPVPYYAQQEEPVLDCSARVQLVEGFSGAGKTAWASESALHISSETVYFDVQGVPAAALPGSISRELAAKFFPTDFEKVFFPGYAGVELLRAVDLELQQRRRRAVVVLDNTHLLDAREVATMIKVTRTAQWVLLAQPSPGVREMEARLGIRSVHLAGWSVGTIASCCATQHLGVDLPLAERIRRVSGGLPLYVRNIVKLAAESYGGNLTAICDDLEAATHDTSTWQELILGRTFGSLTENARNATVVLSMSGVPLGHDEALSMVSHPLSLENQQAASAIRELTEWGVLQRLRDGSIVMHEAFRLIATGHQSTMPQEVTRAAAVHLKNLMLPSMTARPDGPRQLLYLRLLPITGETKAFIDIVSSNSEMFAELGYSSQIEHLLIGSAESDRVSDQDRFWAYDALALWSYQSKDEKLFLRCVANMEKLADRFELDEFHMSALAIKRMLRSGLENNVDAARKYFADAAGLHKGNPETLRILRYDLAVVLFGHGIYGEAATEALSLITEYYDLLGLEWDDVVAKNPPEIAAKIDKSLLIGDDVKRLADTLDLLARARNELGEYSGLARLHAVKFYTIASAVTSVVKTGQDFVDELLTITHDPYAARHFIETVLIPSVNDYKLLDRIVPVRAQYAVVLAYCGKPREALAEIRQLMAFSPSDPMQRAEIANQYRLIAEINQGKVQLEGPTPELPYIPSKSPTTYRRMDRKIGRNEDCPCGSGLKYKRCCGRYPSSPRWPYPAPPSEKKPGA